MVSFDFFTQRRGGAEEKALRFVGMGFQISQQFAGLNETASKQKGGALQRIFALHPLS